MTQLTTFKGSLTASITIIMSYIQNFLKSFIRAYPRVESLSNHIQLKNNLIVNYPLCLKPTSSQRHAIVSQTSISKGNDLMMLSASECMFSSGFTGSTQSEEMHITEQLEQLSLDYDFMNKDFIERIKIYIQLLASAQQTRQKSMPLREYAQYVLGMPEKGLLKSDINSRYLLDLYRSWELSNKTTFAYMKKSLLKRVEEQQFINASLKGRLVIRNAGSSPFLFAAPFLDKLDHSFQSNCEFEMLYLPHRRAPFVRIRSTRSIKAGQRPTINYGRLNNYELLLRYGFSVQNNPNSVFMLPLNFEKIIEVFNKNIEWKQKQLLANNLKLKNFVKIKSSGELSSQDLLMMRILICDSSNPSSQRLGSQAQDKAINNFICEHAKGLRKNIKINNLHVPSNRDIKRLEDQEINILDLYLSKHQA